MSIKPGDKFGRLVVIRSAGFRKFTKSRCRVWSCLCVPCNKKLRVLQWSLRCGETQSCGCLQRERTSTAARKRSSVRVGRRFGALKVVRRLASHEGNGYWECRCRCGSVIDVTSKMLSQGRTTGCGCTRVERALAMARAREKHYDVFGEQLTLKDLAELTGVRAITIWNRLRAGRSIIDATFGFKSHSGKRSRSKASSMRRVHALPKAAST